MNLRKISLALLTIAMSIVSVVMAETIKIPLRELTASPQMELRCVSDSRVIQLPIPERWAVRSAVLNLRYTVSGSMIADVSQLVIKVNGLHVSQSRLTAQAPGVQLSAAIPANLLRAGYNEIQVQVFQHYSKKECEGPCSPDLWTAINLQESFFQIDYAQKPVVLELSKLSEDIFDPRLMPYGEVHIVTEDLSAASATLAGIVASGVARRFDYRKVKFSVSREIKPGADNILIGKRSSIEPVLAKHKIVLGQTEGGYLQVTHMPSESGRPDQTKVLLIVSGETMEAVKIAAETFANITVAFPGSDRLNAFEFAMPDILQYSGREVLNSGRIYAFKTLNFPTQSFIGLNPAGGTISFRLPADFHIKPNQYAKLAMNFSYGAGLKSGSSLTISVNGKNVRAIPLESSGGNFIENYKIEIPTYVFKAGTNSIEFSAKLHIASQMCDLIQPEGLFLTLYENSTLEFPQMPHLVEMPKLELFVHNGFPFTRWPDGHETTVVLGARDDRLLAAGLNLIGFASQKNGFPLFGVRFSYEVAKTGDLILIGLPGNFPDEIASAAPIKLGTMVTQIPYPVIRGWNSESTMAYSKQISALGGGRGLLMEFQSPYESGRTALMLTAGLAEDVLAVSEVLLDADVQVKTRGDLVLIEPAHPESKVTAMNVGRQYMTGKDGDFPILESILYTQPLVYYGAIGLIILLLAWTIFQVIRRYRAKHRPLGTD